MIRTSHSPRWRAFATLLALIGLLAAAALQTARWQVCRDDCCGAFQACPAAVVPESTDSGGCCAGGACGEASAEAAGSARSPRVPDGEYRSLRPDCCSVWSVDVQPGASDQDDLRPQHDQPVLALPVLPQLPTVVATARHRRFGRAPPRVDGRLLAHACTVLLI